MLNVVKSLLFRLKKSKMFWIMLAVCALSPLFYYFVLYLLLDFVASVGGIPTGQMGMPPMVYSILAELPLCSGGVSLWVLLCTSIFLCKEFNDGTIRNAVLSNKSRLSIYFAYVVVGIIVGASFVLAYFVVSLVGVGIPGGFGTLAVGKAIGGILCSLLLGLLLSVMIVSCVVMFIFATGKQSASIVLPLLIILFLPDTIGSIVQLASGLLDVLNGANPENFTSVDISWIPLYNAASFNPYEVDGGLVAKIAMYFVAFTALFGYLGSLAARKKDLK